MLFYYLTFQVFLRKYPENPENAAKGIGYRQSANAGRRQVIGREQNIGIRSGAQQMEKQKRQGEM